MHMYTESENYMCTHNIYTQKYLTKPSLTVNFTLSWFNKLGLAAMTERDKAILSWESNTRGLPTKPYQTVMAGRVVAHW